MERPIRFQPALPEQMGLIKKLYKRAFPANERRPLFLACRNREDMAAELLALTGGKEFLGFALLQTWRDMVHIDYLAVDPACRGQGIGSVLLKKIIERYPHRRIVLELEQQDDSAANALQRRQRKAFYLRNGFVETNLIQRVAGYEMDVMCYRQNSVTAEELDRLLNLAYGPLMARLLCSQALEK